ncbi:MAG: PaaI family thioesterase, partial [Albimonas sp.]|uniref:PaaI family thioesterase n=1 Tax=Albimonas sp. TaxID=1872425 RepID=UPI004056C522
GVRLPRLDPTGGGGVRSPRPPGSALGCDTTDRLGVFFAPPGGDVLLAHGRCLRLGRSVAQCTATIEDAEGRLAATATGTFKLLG